MQPCYFPGCYLAGELIIHLSEAGLIGIIRLHWFEPVGHFVACGLSKSGHIDYYLLDPPPPQ